MCGHIPFSIPVSQQSECIFSLTLKTKNRLLQSTIKKTLETELERFCESFVDMMISEKPII